MAIEFPEWVWRWVDEYLEIIRMGLQNPYDTDLALLVWRAYNKGDREAREHMENEHMVSKKDIAIALAQRTQPYVVRMLQYQEMMYRGIPVSAPDPQEKIADLRGLAADIDCLEKYDYEMNKIDLYVPRSLRKYINDLWPFPSRSND